MKLTKSLTNKIRKLYLAGEGSIADLAKRFEVSEHRAALQKISAKEKWANEKKAVSQKVSKSLKKTVLFEIEKLAQDDAKMLNAHRENLMSDLNFGFGLVGDLFKKWRDGSRKVNVDTLREVLTLTANVIDKIDKLNGNALFFADGMGFSNITSLETLANWVAKASSRLAGSNFARQSVTTLGHILKDKETVATRDKVPYEAIEMQIETTNIIVEAIAKDQEAKDIASRILKERSLLIRKLLK